MLGPVVFGSLFAIAILLLYADQGIRKRFSGELHVQPAYVYARPLPIESGRRLSVEDLVSSLEQRDYRQLDEAREPGTFSRNASSVDVALREIDPDLEQQPTRAVRFSFEHNRLVAIVGLADGISSDRVYLGPLLIGNLQLGAYEDRIPTQLHDLPESLIHALLVMEDRDFHSHMGVDPSAIGRALWFNIRQGKTVQGGSTLTQQLVKNLFLSPQRTLSRKGLEALMAVMMELRFSKAEILELYLNEIFLGQAGNRAVHGFALASEFYFGKPVHELALHESATLVGIVPAPSWYNPRRHPDRAIKRRNLVLGTLVETGYIDGETAASAEQQPLGIVELTDQSSSEFPAYIDYLHRQLRQYYSENVLRNDGLKLYTSLDTTIQRSAQNGLADTLALLEKNLGLADNTLQGSAIVVDIRKGELLALVGDRIRGYSGFNRSVDAYRPIGSLVKPVVYLTALEQPDRYSLATWLDDSPLTIESRGTLPWSPQNYDKQYRGDTTVIEALTHSYNVPTVRLGLEVGVENVVNTLHRLGVERHIDSYPSTLLGASQHSPLEMAQVYQVLGNEGKCLALGPHPVADSRVVPMKRPGLRLTAADRFRSAGAWRKRRRVEREARQRIVCGYPGRRRAKG